MAYNYERKIKTNVKRKENMTTIAIANQKGGVGKTTTSIELAASLSTEGKKVLLIDFDQQCNMTKYVGIDSEPPTINEVLHGDSPIADAIRKLDLYDVIPASTALSAADRSFTDAADIFLLQDALEIIRDDYDYNYVIIDNSPARNILLNMAYIASDYVLIPTECDAGSLDGILAVNTDLRKFREGRHAFSKARIMGFILTKYERTTMHSDSYKELEDMRDVIEPDAFIMTVRKSIVASETKVIQKSLQEADKYSKPAIDYRKIAEEVIRRTA